MAKFTKSYHIDTDRMPWSAESVGVETSKDFEEILEESGLNFEVEKAPAYDIIDFDRFLANPLEKGNLRQIEGQFNVRRVDNHKILTPKTVSEIYTPCQNEDFFKMPRQLLEEGKVIIEAAGALGGGARPFLICRFVDSLDTDFRPDPDAPEDLVCPKIAFLGSHDGSATLTIRLVAYRLACGNMLGNMNAVFNAAKRAHIGRTFKIRHTKTVHDRVFQAANLLAGMREEWTATAGVMRKLVQYPADFKLMNNIIRDVVQGTDNEQRAMKEDELPTRTQNIIAGYMDMTNNPSLGTHGKTLWDVYNAVTAYNTHERNIRKGNSLFGNILEGAGSKAEERCLRILAPMVAEK